VFIGGHVLKFGLGVPDTARCPEHVDVARARAAGWHRPLRACAADRGVIPGVWKLIQDYKSGISYYTIVEYVRVDSSEFTVWSQTLRCAVSSAQAAAECFAAVGLSRRGRTPERDAEIMTCRVAVSIAVHTPGGYLFEAVRAPLKCLLAAVILVGLTVVGLTGLTCDHLTPSRTLTE